MMRFLLFLIVMLLVLFLIKTLFRKREPWDTKLYISIMLFAGLGFAIGDYYLGLGWALFGAIFGILIGIELKEKLFKLLEMLYRDIVEK